MKKFVIIAAVLLSGCVSIQIKPPAGSLDNIRKIELVPMESAPLEITSLSDKLSKYSVKDEKSFDSMMASDELWIPTSVLVQEAAKQISVHGVYSVITKQNLQKLTGITDKERTLLGENWQSLLRKWYNQDISEYEYKSHIKDGIDAVLEVGLINYSLVGERFIIQLGLKLVDPETGRVIGRARAADYPVIDEEVFKKNGDKFRHIFGFISKRLLNENLQYIGLVPY